MKVAIVTGASKGIGKAIADELKTHEYVVHGVNRANCDVTDNDAILRFVADIPRIDVLVNCAGVSHLGAIENLTEKDIESVYQANVLGTIRFCKAVLPIMKKQGSGYIINIGSLRGVVCSPGKAAYSMSKFAVRAFSNTLGLEVREHGIKVTCINPGFVYTELIRHRVAKEKLRPTDVVQSIDIAKTIIYLLSLSKGVYIPEVNIGEVWE